MSLGQEGNQAQGEEEGFQEGRLICHTIFIEGDGA